jgi:hypothetical protein
MMRGVAIASPVSRGGIRLDGSEKKTPGRPSQ